MALFESSLSDFTNHISLRASQVPPPQEQPFQQEKMISAQESLEKGNELCNEGKFSEAAEWYRKSLKVQESGDGYYNLANCLYSVGQPQDAIENWIKSLALDLTRSDAHVNLGNVYALHLKNYEKAFSHYEAALRLYPDDGQTHYNYACVLDSQSQLEKAIEHYKLARKHGIDMAEKNLRNAMAKLLGSVSK